MLSLLCQHESQSFGHPKDKLVPRPLLISLYSPLGINFPIDLATVLFEQVLLIDVLGKLRVVNNMDLEVISLVLELGGCNSTYTLGHFLLEHKFSKSDHDLGDKSRANDVNGVDSRREMFHQCSAEQR